MGITERVLARSAAWAVVIDSPMAPLLLTSPGVQRYEFHAVGLMSHTPSGHLGRLAMDRRNQEIRRLSPAAARLLLDAVEDGRIPSGVLPQSLVERASQRLGRDHKTALIIWMPGSNGYPVLCGTPDLALHRCARSANHAGLGSPAASTTALPTDIYEAIREHEEAQLQYSA